MQSRRDVKDIDIKESLQCVGALRVKDISDQSVRDDLAAMNSSSASSVALANIQVRKKIGKKYQSDGHNNWLEQKRSTLLVVATLIAAMAFQAGINPSVFDSKDTGSSLFLIFNSIGFIASLTIILLLISRLPLKNRVSVWILMAIMWVAITSMALAYLGSLYLWAPTAEEHLQDVVLSIVIVWIGIIVIGHAIRLIVKLVRYARSRDL